MKRKSRKEIEKLEIFRDYAAINLKTIESNRTEYLKNK